MPLQVILNGQSRDFATLEPPATLAALIAEMALKPDRVAVELNGNIVERTRWVEAQIHSGDRLEIVHFVGGGAA